MIWDLWKQGFTAWEQATAQYLEKVLSNPGVLGPSGAMLTTVLKAKAGADRALATCWSVLGLPTRRDQERTLHKLNQLESQLFDLQERLELRDDRDRHEHRAAPPHDAPAETHATAPGAPRAHARRS